jgi:ectoine hydroxylase-related dioxygenase (phytanoyl-CoA dioxygenase family)
MTTEFGPLRIIPGSHRTGMLLKPEEISVPHPDEILLSLKAGDVVFFHNAMLHSGTPNTSGSPRLFIGGSYNSTWMRHKDDHSGPNVQKLIEHARERNDHRLMRLFGIDDHLEKRINSGFTISDDIRWAEWAAADKAAIKKT